MYDKIGITENTLRVLSLFTDFCGEYYIREVEKLLKISPRTAQLILEDLESKGIIESKFRGKIKAYKLRVCEFSKRYMVFVEQYKSITFLDSKPLIKEVIGRIINHIEGIGLVFGSYAKGLEKKGSDLDIFVAGKFDDAKIRKISNIFGIEISVKCYPLKLFEKSKKDDILLNEVLKDHVVFVNAELFVETMLSDG